MVKNKSLVWWSLNIRLFYLHGLSEKEYKCFTAVPNVQLQHIYNFGTRRGGDAIILGCKNENVQAFSYHVRTRAEETDYEGPALLSSK